MIQYVSNNDTKSLNGVRITSNTGVANCFIDDSYKHLHYSKNNKDFFLINNFDMKGGDYYQETIDGLVIGDRLCCRNFAFSQPTKMFQIIVSIDSASYNNPYTPPYHSTTYKHSIQYDIKLRVFGYGDVINFSPKMAVNTRISGGANGAVVSKTLSKYASSGDYRTNVTFNWSTSSQITEKPDLRPTDFALQIGGTWVSLDKVDISSWNVSLNTIGGYYWFGLKANSSKWGVELDS